MRAWWAIACLGCGRLGFDGTESTSPAPPVLASGDIVIAAHPDGDRFGLAWNATNPDQTSSWFYGLVGTNADWIVPPVELVADRPEPVQSTQLTRVADRWLLSRSYDDGSLVSPISLAVFDDAGVVIADVFDDRYFNGARVIPRDDQFLTVFQHQHVQSDAMSRRQVFAQVYDANAEVVGNQVLIDEVLDNRTLKAAAMVDGRPLVVAREDAGGFRYRFATLDDTGNASTTGTVALVSSSTWAPELHVAGTRALFVRTNDAALRLHRMEADGTASWSPHEIDVPLGTNRMEARDWAAASDPIALYVAWESDVATEAPAIALGRVDASGTSPVMATMELLTDGSTPALRPAVAISPTHTAVAYVIERDGQPSLGIAIRDR